MTTNHDRDNPATAAQAGDSGVAPGVRMDRRLAIKWMLAATAAVAVGDRLANCSADEVRSTSGIGYGSDPDLTRSYKPGDCWPLTFTPEQRRTVGILCDVIIPADEESPAATMVGVPDFIDEWISAPYPRHVIDRQQILQGLIWLDRESMDRFDRLFVDITDPQMRAICNDICYAPVAKPDVRSAARFFARFRDLTAGAYYTTPQGTKALKYVGNTPLASWEGPPGEVLAKVGLI